MKTGGQTYRKDRSQRKSRREIGGKYGNLVL